MEIEYWDFPNEKKNVDELKLPRAKAFFNTISKSPYCNKVKICSQENGNELLYFDIEPELGQYRINDIRNIERLCIHFFEKDNYIPYVFALRKDFPKVPHTNLFPIGFPISLCIYETPFEELKITWTPSAFLEDIRNWLSKTAKGELHQIDQPLEPFLIDDEGSIIMPFELNEKRAYEVFFCNNIKNKRNLYYLVEKVNTSNTGLSFAVLTMKGEPQIHGIINNTPSNFQDLDFFLQNAQIDFKKEVVKYIEKQIDEKQNLQLRLLIAVWLPKKRYIDGEIVKEELYTFLTTDTISNISIKLGLWELLPDSTHLGKVMFAREPDKKEMEVISVGLLKPHFYFNKATAQVLNNIKSSDKEISIFAIGLGALGSQIFMNLCRSGFGKWVLMDDDLLLPHNLARHFLNAKQIGSNKAIALAALANELLNEESYAFAINGDILNEADEVKIQLISEKLNDSNVVLDMSASLAVSRHISNNERFKSKRIISCFLNPTGTHLVVLGEDSLKEYKLDFIEVCYYRELLNNKALEKHFENHLDGVRYSSNCRDVSNRIPQDNVSLLSSISSKVFKDFVSQNAYIASIWCFTESDATVNKQIVRVGKPQQVEKSGWRITFDDIFFEKINKARQQKLPNETGGILIGSYDMEHKKIFIVDTIIPNDNIEYPTAFYRGVSGLKERLGKIRTVTSNMLTYVGEWHSHPKNCSTEPSNDDKILLCWLSEQMSIEGLPAIMLIIGDDLKYTVNIEI